VRTDLSPLEDPWISYILDRDNLGGFDSAGDAVVQEVDVSPNDTSLGRGVFGQPVLFNGAVYVAANRKPIQRFTINATRRSHQRQPRTGCSLRV